MPTQTAAKAVKTRGGNRMSTGRQNGRQRGAQGPEWRVTGELPPHPRGRRQDPALVKLVEEALGDGEIRQRDVPAADAKNLVGRLRRAAANRSWTLRVRITPHPRKADVMIVSFQRGTRIQ